eukprot:GILK01009239.1.p1 GENE.GILK01009239.1~~GILK01009239.1.p1  ORF type:complete len:446 (-),score=48.55 GILK01009239.1:413-1750(-)
MLAAFASQRPSLKLPQSNFVSSFVLISWDYLLGSVVEQVWAGLEDITSDTLTYLSRQTLDGEIYRKLDSDDMESKFHVFSDLDLIVTDVIFTAANPRGKGTTKFSLALCVPKRFISRYLLLSSAFEERLGYITAILREFLNRSTASALGHFTPILTQELAHWEILFGSAIPDPEFSRTLLSTHTPASSGRISKEFLAKCLTSHLQTLGCSVVLGNAGQEPLVNCMIETLAMLLSPEERCRSSYVVPGQGFVPDLVLQGTLKMDSITAEGILRSSLPITIINLDRMTVSATRQYHEFLLLRQEYLQRYVKRIASEKKSSSDPLLATSNVLFQTVHHAAPIVESLLQQLSHLSEVLRPHYILNSLRLVQQRALLVSQYVNAELLETKRPALVSQTIRRIRDDLDIASDEDWAILLACAEKATPGTYTAVRGNPVPVGARVLDLFPDF